MAEPTEIEIRKILCCPGGCCREDDCFVDGRKHRFTTSRRELDQAKAIMTRFRLVPRSGDDVGESSKP